MNNDTKSPTMHRKLKNRHMQMIALGAAVGTGLFYGSAPTIQLVGPGIILSYLLTGIFIFFVMRMLGEMTVREPVSASFSHFAGKYWHPFMGYLSGWNYWTLYMLAGMAELAAIAVYMNYWFPALPQWLSTLICIVIITAINLSTVRAYGEAEFWASFIKIGAIVAMILFGFYLIFATMGTFPQNFSNLWTNGGFFPNGGWGFLCSLAIVMFSFGGVELIGITAGEAENPEKSLPRAINELLLRILIFYVGTMVVLMTLAPWNKVGMEASPFVQIFETIGIPAAANILNFVVLVAALSVFNSVLYSNSRMLYGMAMHGNAPKIFANLSVHGVPLLATLFSALLSLVIVLATYIYPQAGKVFMNLLALVVSGIVINWAVIIITHLKFRARFQQENRLKELHFKAFGYPILNYLCLLYLLAMVVVMWFMDSMRISVIAIPVWIIFLYITYKLKPKTNLPTPPVK
jgi:phenylalanine-specific permease